MALAAARVKSTWYLDFFLVPLKDFTWLPPGHDFTSQREKVE